MLDEEPWAIQYQNMASLFTLTFIECHRFFSEDDILKMSQLLADESWEY